MGLSKDQLLQLLQDQKIQFSRIDHPVVMTVDAQAKYVGDNKGGLSKNLFLKDKKGRFYIVSALADTKIDLKVLQNRLGVGKGGLRMAPEEAFAEILQVPLGSVTPFALVNESARNVSLLLDQGFKTKDCCFFHPLSNDTTIALNIEDVESFLKSDGRLVAYVDLEANPPIGKDSPPDLAALVPSLAPSDAPSVKDVVEKTASLKIDGAVNSKPVSDTAKSSKVSKVPPKEKMASTASSSHSFADPEKFIEEILEKASAIVLSEIKEENIKQHGDQLGTVVSNSMKKKLSLELKNLATMFKNTAYTEGFGAEGDNIHRFLVQSPKPQPSPCQKRNSQCPRDLPIIKGKPPTPSPNSPLPTPSLLFISFNIGSSPASNYNAPVGSTSFEDEPPLLEELGINTKQIWTKMIPILNLFRVKSDLHEDADLSGPFLFLMAFGLFQLLAGKLHFGDYIGLGYNCVFVFVCRLQYVGWEEWELGFVSLFEFDWVLYVAGCYIVGFGVVCASRRCGGVWDDGGVCDLAYEGLCQVVGGVGVMWQ
ncbi:ybaK/aminoacyl-tRNA synthetase-associated domain-containing protein [Artemisia annua]|uniref:YbaK/aminoacyl-tRNA synthetase-associated domain-containing protein n=1 Tax=Artemisia annua TaxID=35608 RepID=A0A2U1PD28_ARTAN|nr:ybaK/aminoacyl-tRNA synthetase-associated domain-containing protein [Artemisia annua]